MILTPTSSCAHKRSAVTTRPSTANLKLPGLIPALREQAVSKRFAFRNVPPNRLLSNFNILRTRPRQQQHYRMRSQPLPGPDCIQFFVSGGFDADLLRRHRQILGDAFAHQRNVRHQLGPLAHHRNIRIAEPITFRLHQRKAGSQ